MPPHRSRERAFIAPTAVYLASIIVVILIGLFRSAPAAELPTAQVTSLHTVGVLVLLKAFANECAALTRVEAIANAMPSFRKPAVRSAQHAEMVLGGLLAVMLIGIAILIEKFETHPVPGVTVLSQVTTAALGDGFGYYLVRFATVLLLALAANTSFGGLPVLAQLLAQHNNLPHLFALRAERQVHRYGIWFLTATSAILLVVADGQMNVLLLVSAIGVFVGFTLSQVDMVRHCIARVCGRLAVAGRAEWVRCRSPRAADRAPLYRLTSNQHRRLYRPGSIDATIDLCR